MEWSEVLVGSPYIAFSIYLRREGGVAVKALGTGLTPKPHSPTRCSV